MSDINQQKLALISEVITHLINAIGDDTVTMRRALILIDVDEHPQTTQSDMIERLDQDKSTLSRNIDWLSDHGCIDRRGTIEDARIFQLRSSDYSSRHIGYALNSFAGSHTYLKKFVNEIISLFKDKMPTMREALLLATLGAMDEASPQELNERLSDLPASTQRRITAALIEDGLIVKDE